MPRNSEAKALKLVDQGHYVIATGLLQGILAKELCSCVFVSQTGGLSKTPAQRAEICLAKSQLPISPGLIKALVNRDVDPKTKSLEIDPTLLGAFLGLFQGPRELARYEGPKRGCRLLTDEERDARSFQSKPTTK